MEDTKMLAVNIKSHIFDKLVEMTTRQSLTQADLIERSLILYWRQSNPSVTQSCLLSTLSELHTSEESLEEKMNAICSVSVSTTKQILEEFGIGDGKMDRNSVVKSIKRALIEAAVNGNHYAWKLDKRGNPTGEKQSRDTLGGKLYNKVYTYACSHYGADGIELLGEGVF